MWSFDHESQAKIVPFCPLRHTSIGLTLRYCLYYGPWIFLKRWASKIQWLSVSPATSQQALDCVAHVMWFTSLDLVLSVGIWYDKFVWLKRDYTSLHWWGTHWTYLLLLLLQSFGPGYYEYCLCLCRDSEYFINTLFSRIHTFIIWGRLFAALQYSMKCLQAVCSKQLPCSCFLWHLHLIICSCSLIGFQYT